MKSTTMKFNFIKPTLIFSVVGLFVPGFTAIVLVGLQVLLSKIGIGCWNAWKIIWTTTTMAGLILPFLFYRNIKALNVDKSESLFARLIFVNLLEYIFIQSSLTPLFTSGHTLCYVTDGQNGIGLVFAAWLALPILLIFSFIFRQTFKSTNIGHSDK
jgi:hypothetical protein